MLGVACLRAARRAVSTAARKALSEPGDAGGVAARDVLVALAQEDRDGRWPADGDELLVRSIEVLDKNESGAPLNCQAAHSAASMRRRLVDPKPVLRIVRRALANEYMSGYGKTEPSTAAQLLVAAAVVRITTRKDGHYLNPLPTLAAAGSGPPPEELAVTVWAAATLRFSGDEGSGLRVNKLIEAALKFHNTRRVPLPFGILQAFAWAVGALGWRWTEPSRKTGIPELCAYLVSETERQHRPTDAAVGVGTPEAKAYLHDVVSSMTTLATLASPDIEAVAKLITPPLAVLADEKTATACLVASAMGRYILDASLTQHFLHTKGSLDHQIAVVRYVYQHSSLLRGVAYKAVEAESVGRLLNKMDLSRLSLSDVAMLFRFAASRHAYKRGTEALIPSLEALVLKVMDSVRLEQLDGMEARQQHSARTRMAGVDINLPIVLSNVAFVKGVSHPFIDSAVKKLNEIDWALVRQSTKTLSGIMTCLACQSRGEAVLALAEKVARVMTCRHDLEPLEAERCVANIKRLQLADETELVDTITANRRMTRLSPTDIEGILRGAEKDHTMSIEMAIRNLDKVRIEKTSPAYARSMLSSFARLSTYPEEVCQALTERALGDEAQGVEKDSVVRLVFSIAKLSVLSGSPELAKSTISRVDAAKGGELKPEQYTTLIYSLAKCKLRDMTLFDASADLILRSEVLDTYSHPGHLIDMLWGAALVHFTTLQSKRIYMKALRALDPEAVADLGIGSIDRLYFVLSRFAMWRHDDSSVMHMVQMLTSVLPRSRALADVPTRPSACTSIAHVWHVYRLPKSVPVEEALRSIEGLKALEAPTVSKLCNSYAWMRLVPDAIFKEGADVVCKARHGGSLSMMLGAHRRAGLPPDEKLMHTAAEVALMDPTTLPLTIHRTFISLTRYEYYLSHPETFSRLAQRFVACLVGGKDIRLSPPEIILVLRARSKAPTVFPNQLVSLLRPMVGEMGSGRP